MGRPKINGLSSLWLLIAANLFDMFVLKYIEAERNIRTDALKINEIEKRRNLV